MSFRTFSRESRTLDDKRFRSRCRALKIIKRADVSPEVELFHYGNRQQMRAAEKYLLRNCRGA